LSPSLRRSVEAGEWETGGKCIICAESGGFGALKVCENMLRLGKVLGAVHLLGPMQIGEQQKGRNGTQRNVQGAAHGNLIVG